MCEVSLSFIISRQSTFLERLLHKVVSISQLSPFEVLSPAAYCRCRTRPGLHLFRGPGLHHAEAGAGRRARAHSGRIEPEARVACSPVTHARGQQVHL